jgi:hypothetical protein
MDSGKFTNPFDTSVSISVLESLGTLLKELENLKQFDSVSVKGMAGVDLMGMPLTQDLSV